VQLNFATKRELQLKSLRQIFRQAENWSPANGTALYLKKMPNGLKNDQRIKRIVI